MAGSPSSATAAPAAAGATASAEHRTAQRDASDLPYLKALCGRYVQRYFSGFGLYSGKIVSVDSLNYTACVVYEDGDAEHLFLDQLQSYVKPLDFQPEGALGSSLAGSASGSGAGGGGWLSHHLIVEEPRRRRLTEAAIEAQMWEETRRLSRERRQPRDVAKAAEGGRSGSTQSKSSHDQDKGGKSLSKAQPAAKAASNSRKSPSSVAEIAKRVALEVFAARQSNGQAATTNGHRRSHKATKPSSTSKAGKAQAPRLDPYTVKVCFAFSLA